MAELKRDRGPATPKERSQCHYFERASFGEPVYVDRRLTANSHIVVPAGSHTDTIDMSYADFNRIVQPVCR